MPYLVAFVSFLVLAAGLRSVWLALVELRRVKSVGSRGDMDFAVTADPLGVEVMQLNLALSKVRLENEELKAMLMERSRADVEARRLIEAKERDIRELRETVVELRRQKRRYVSRTSVASYAGR